VYRRSGDTFNELTVPAINTNAVTAYRDAVFSSSGKFLAVGYTSTYVTHGDYVQIYVNATATNGGQITIPHIALATGSAILNP
jgi:hypothetical protein